MKIVGGPRNGQMITISEEPGGPELVIEGMVVQYTYESHDRVKIEMYFDEHPKPSLAGLVERYQCRDGAWHYVEPTSGGDARATPPIVME